MKMGFNQNQFDRDLEETKNLLVGFLKSLGPKQKKMGERPVGFMEEQKVRFRLNLVEMGISLILRICLAVVGFIIFLPLFLSSDGFFKVVFSLAFVGFVSWLLLDHLKAGAKDGSRVAGFFVAFNEKRETAQDAVTGTTTSILQKILDIIPNTLKAIGDSLTKKDS